MTSIESFRHWHCTMSTDSDALAFLNRLLWFFGLLLPHCVCDAQLIMIMSNPCQYIGITLDLPWSLQHRSQLSWRTLELFSISLSVKHCTQHYWILLHDNNLLVVTIFSYVLAVGNWYMHLLFFFGDNSLGSTCMKTYRNNSRQSIMIMDCISFMLTLIILKWCCY